jgi:hypothetical protein
MIIDLFDAEKKKDVTLILEKENVIPSNDLYVVFISRDTTCGLFNGVSSSPYNEYFFKKINHIINAVTEYEGQKYSLTIGYFLSENTFIPFLIDQTGYKTDYSKFENASYCDETCYTEYKIFNYKEYSELIELGLINLSFKEFIAQLIEKRIDKEYYQLYTIPQKGIDKYLTNTEFGVFLDEEEKLKGGKIN